MRSFEMYKSFSKSTTLEKLTKMNQDVHFIEKLTLMSFSGKVKRGGCSGCLTRTPYATLIALIMCWAGSAVFCGTMYRWG